MGLGGDQTVEAVPDFRVAAARAKGFTLVCATCKRLREGEDQNLDGCTVATEGLDCRGPFGLGTYPHYDGPLKASDGQFLACCFVCGEEPVGAVKPGRVEMSPMFGLCQKHLSEMGWVTRPGEKPHTLSHIDAPILR